MKPKLFCFACLIFILLPSAVFAVSPEIQKLIGQAFAEKETASIERILQTAAGQASDPADIKYVYTALASLSERSGNSMAAFEQYKTAALAIPGVRDDSLYLDSVRCAILANETDKAGEMAQAVLLTSFDETILLRARMYSAWIELASGDRQKALALFRSFSTNKQFEQYGPAILFTLWWSTGDNGVAKSLQDRYPKSPEAAAARGELLLSPSPFWYLMEREGMPGFTLADIDRPAGTQSTETVAVVEPEKPGSPAPVGKGPWQQTGFFRNRENAESLAEVLRQRGFAPVVREDTRPSGTIYFAVLVPDDGTTAARLKDAGFESYLVRD